MGERGSPAYPHEWIGQPRCMICGYDLTGLPDDHFCPECGFGYQLSATNAIVKGELDRQRACADTALAAAVGAAVVNLLAAAGQNAQPLGFMMLAIAPTLFLMPVRAHFSGVALGARILGRIWATAGLLLISVFWPAINGLIAVALLAVGLHSLLVNRTRFPHALDALREDLLRRLRTRRRVAYGAMVVCGAGVLITLPYCW